MGWFTQKRESEPGSLEEDLEYLQRLHVEERGKLWKFKALLIAIAFQWGRSHHPRQHAPPSNRRTRAARSKIFKLTHHPKSRNKILILNGSTFSRIIRLTDKAIR
jgi:hypothetical protein